MSNSMDYDLLIIGCVPSKAMLRAGEINHMAKNNPFIGLQTSAGQVEKASHHI
jgi:mercuric reductase